MNAISEKVKAAGVVGAGGAGFPTHVKLDAKADTYLVNCAECEPMLRVDQQLAAFYPKLLIKGLQYAMEATGAKTGIIALKAKYESAIKALEGILPSNIKLFILRDIYPAGDEVITIYLATGRRVPPGGLPLDVGVVVNNVQTLINVAKAMEDEPVIKKTLTVTGFVHLPLTLSVPVGAPLKEILVLAGGSKIKEAAFIAGGPLMGSIITDLEKPVTKTISALIVLPKEHLLIKRKKQSAANILRIAKTVCEQCCYCTELCPRHIIGHELSPHLIIRAVNYNFLGNPSVIKSALTCSECGVCETYSCPVGISPMAVNKALKEKLRSENISYQGMLNQEDPMAAHRLVSSSLLAAKLNLKDLYLLKAPLKNESEENYLPQKVKLLLKQHLGAPSIPIIQEGDKVQKGQLIAKIPEGALGASLHASISGIIEEVSPEVITIGGEG